MRFVQTIWFSSVNADAIAELMREWHAAEAGIAPGYVGSRLLADREHPGRYLVVVDFASAADAERNNDRPETQAWAEKFRALLDGEPAFANFDEVARTG